MKIKGKIEETDEIKETAKIGSYKLGVKVAGNWYGIFGSKVELEHIAEQAKVGATADIEYEMRGTYRNVKSTEIQIQVEQKKPEPTQADERKHEEKVGKEIVENYRKQRIASFQEDIEDAVKILEPWKNMTNPDVHWDKVISVATTLHISGARKGLK